MSKLIDFKTLLDHEGVDYGGLSDDQLLRVRGLPCIDNALRQMYELNAAENAVRESLFGPKRPEPD